MRALVAALWAVPMIALAEPDAGAALSVEEWTAEAPAEASSPDAGPVPWQAAPSELSGPAEFQSARPADPPRLRARLGGQVAVDTRFEPTPALGWAENAFDADAWAVVGAEIRLGERSSLSLEARARWRAAAQAGFGRPKADAEAWLGETFLDLYGAWADLRIGWQRIPLGANAVLAPADALNARDLRTGALFGEPDGALLPAPAVRAQGELGPVRWLLAYVPFFQPHRYALIGQDAALIQPAAEAYFPLALDPTIEDLATEHLLETQRPPGFGVSGDLAARASVELWKTRLGVGWLWANEKFPALSVDPELAYLMKAVSLERAPDPAVLVSVQNRLAAGEPLFRGTYPRRHLLWAEGSAIAGPVQVDVDLAYSPAQTFFSDGLGALRRPAVTWVLGVSPAERTEVTYAVTYLGMAVPGVPADELLFLLEPSTARGAERTAWFHLVAAAVSRTFFDDSLEVALAVAVEPVQRSFTIAPRVTYRVADQVRVGLGAAFYEGPPTSPFGYVDRNDEVAVSVEWEPL